MSRIVILALKDLRLLWRDRFGLFWILVFPLVFALFFGSIFGGIGGARRAPLKIAVVQEDESDAARAYIERITASPALEARRMEREAAREEVRRGRRSAFVAIRPGFGEALANLLQGGAPALELGIDPARSAEAGYLQGLLVEALFASMQERVRSVAPGMRGPELTVTPVSSAASRPHSPFEITFPSAIQWALLGCAAGFAISLVRERTAGTWLRLRSGPVTRAAILAGKGLACYCACIAVTLLLLMFAVLALGVRLGNPAMLALALASSAACFSGLMMMVCVLGKTEQSVAGAGWAIFTLMAMIGGGMVPLIAMPAWMVTLSNVSPVKWGIVALEGAIWRGFALSEMALPCAILWAIGLGGLGAGVRLLARADR
ncbi:MAG: ABC transporter permease [Planctomycetaceae bacterium]